jgi:hypothetical protein
MAGLQSSYTQCFNRRHKRVGHLFQRPLQGPGKRWGRGKRWGPARDGLLIETPEPTLSRGMQHLNGAYTQSFNRRHRRVGHLLQGRFKAIRVSPGSIRRAARAGEPPLPAEPPPHPAFLGQTHRFTDLTPTASLMLDPDSLPMPAVRQLLRFPQTRAPACDVTKPGRSCPSPRRADHWSANRSVWLSLFPGSRSKNCPRTGTPCR